jgi:site-specific DNA recombinase
MSLLVAYTRVSSEHQKDNTSLPLQLERIQAYCHAAGHLLIGHFEDVESASGKKVRPQFKRALDMVINGAAEGIVCMRLDRFARSTLEGLKVVQELNQSGKQLVVLDLNLDTSTPVGRCMLSVLLSFAELERETINYRTGEGRRKVIEAGGYAFGRPPYGWDAVDKRLIPNPFEQTMLSLIFELRDNGYSYKRIAKELNMRGVPAKSANKQWTYSTVRLILNRQRYKLAHVMGEGEHGRAS